MAANEVSRVMGHGLARLDSHLPDRRGGSLFGELRRFLDQPGVAQRATDTAASSAATGAGRLAQRWNEADRDVWERYVHVSARKRAEEAARVETVAKLGGIVGGFLARKAIQGVDRVAERGNREAVARLVWQVVGLAGRADDGSVDVFNQALLWCVLDSFHLDDRMRVRLAASAPPASLAALGDCRLEGALLEAVATLAFHARANVVGPEAAVDVAPLFVRMGMARTAGEQFAGAARADYLAGRGSLSHHYRTLLVSVSGIGRELRLSQEVIERAAHRVIAFDPYEAARAANRRVLASILRSGGDAAAMLAGGPVGPAMSIAATVATLLLGSSARPVTPAAVDAAFVSFGQQAQLAPPSVRSWINGEN